MDNTKETTFRRESQEDVIVLGVASIETKGLQPGFAEGMTDFNVRQIAEE
ncbi:hypothetical protein LDO26_00885 [Luteimonas sp. BDR2-5]|nr:hypothetical protein [Luteimonas sp. BDR2-5]MCD9026770.1 hypothetical protein [Luteimonas sp. BDR2-5]